MLKRFILWDFKRGSWQYDVMVGIILLFIFLTPRQWFGDGPRIPQTRGIAMLPAENGGWAFFVDPKEDMAVVFMTQAIVDTARRVRLRRDLRSLIYGAMTQSYA